MTALTSTGLRHAVATLLQLVGSDGSVPCGRIEDWPDFRFRVADWLLNVEINRWGYERGDGRDAVFARMCRKLDLAARHKLNLVWFDGFGWDPDRRPGYADFARELSRHARSLGIGLAHSGYGGGYGFAYQASDIYTGDYMGRAFENRRPWPDGDLYPCLGHPGYERSWTWGTCLSNEGLLAAKLDELTDFVRACEPGMLYVHDIDTGDWGLTAAAWLRRCEACRRRWPNDDAAAEGGMAGAYAEWFRALVDAVGAVRSADGAYDAARDCILASVGPVYTHAPDSDADWDESLRYFETLSRLIGPAPNLQFGIREQFASDREPHLRVAELSALLDSVGNGHGVLVVSFAGGDSYYSDQLVAPSATLARHFVGAATCYIVNNGSAVEPAQLVAAEYAWHADAPGAAPLATDRTDGLRLWEASRAGDLRPPEVYGPGGVIERACERLYGPVAGAHLAEVFQSGAGVESPVVMVWRTITAEVAELREGQAEELLERDTFWYDRAEATQRAITAVADALQTEGLASAVAEDLRWLHSTLEIGEQFADGVGMAHGMSAPGDTAELREQASEAREVAEDLRRQIEVVAHDLQTEGLTPEAAEKLRWRQEFLEVNVRLGEGGANLGEMLADIVEEGRVHLREHWLTLERRIREDFPTDTFDPVGGDLELWLPTLAALAAIAPTDRLP